MHILSVVVTYRLLCPCYCLQLWYDKGNNKPNEHFQVQTTKGRVTGHLANGSHTVLEYLGIPYARPPVGDLRLAPPQRFTGNSDYEAANFGYDCPLTTPPPLGYPDLTPQADRILNSFASGNKTPQSEDCLTLNIWGRRAKSFQRRRKPVLIFFYGGRFTIGNTNSPFYNGKHFAEAEDVLIVTVNYRINIFGFPGAPGLTQNLGLRDQRAAVEWLRDNIEAFGGDRNRMTISGQSSGAVAVDYWSYAYKADPIVKGLILQSGNALSFPLNEAEVQKRNWDTVIQAVNCSSATDAVSCVRAVDWNTLKDAAAQIRPSRSSSVLRSIPAFYPVADEEIVFSDYVDRAKAVQPAILGSTHNEAGYYKLPAYANKIVPTPEQVDLFHLESFICPNSNVSRVMSEQGVPIWWYQYYGDCDNVRLYPTSGAYHGTELHMIFGASQEVSGLPPSKDQVEATRLVQRAWATFMSDPKDGLAEVLGWPKFKPGRKTVVRLAYNNSPKASFVDSAIFDSRCENVALGSLGEAA